MRQREEAAVEPKGNLALEDLYRASEVGSLELTSAMKLLPEAVKWTELAISALDAMELFQADDAMLHVHSLMPELFCCRTLGEGFGVVVNAVLSSFENRNGSPMEKPQIEAIRRALLAIRSSPRITFDHALDYVTAMETAGLDVAPLGTNDIAELLSE